MKVIRLMALLIALVVPFPLVGAVSGQEAPEGPTVPFQGSYPITVEAGEYDLIYLVLDFAPGAAIPFHFHGGPAMVVGMEGELTLRPEGQPEKKLRPTDVVNERMGAKHEMLNVSNANARISAAVLLPKGADLTTVLATDDTRPGPTVPFMGTYPVTAAAGEYDLVNLVLDFAPGAAIPTHYHGGPAVVVGMTGELTLRPQGAAEKKLRPTDVVQEKMGAVHEMINVSSAPAIILAGVLLPKGAELTTLVQMPAHSEHSSAPSGMPRTGGVDSTTLFMLAIAGGLVFIVLGALALRGRAWENRR
jgi:quercetin dioxygenase-like cupin family protein